MVCFVLNPTRRLVTIDSIPRHLGLSSAPANVKLPTESHANQHMYQINISYKKKRNPSLKTLFHQLRDCSIAVFVTTGSYQPTNGLRCALNWFVHRLDNKSAHPVMLKIRSEAKPVGDNPRCDVSYFESSFLFCLPARNRGRGRLVSLSLMAHMGKGQKERCQT